MAHVVCDGLDIALGRRVGMHLDGLFMLKVIMMSDLTPSAHPRGVCLAASQSLNRAQVARSVLPSIFLNMVRPLPLGPRSGLRGGGSEWNLCHV
jgi:hypothetical protein